MDVVVLVKAVPSLDELAYDPVRHTLDRDHPTLLPNPFDARALAAALRERAPGERVIAVSMGPPSARTVLDTALQLGADRAILVTDPVLAGSDLPATARVLATAVRRISHDLLITGRASTDGECGVLGAMVAEHLDRSLVGPARSFRRISPQELEVVTDTELGASTYRLTLPAVLVTGEKVSKPGRVTPEMAAQAAGRTPELWDLPSLEIDPGTVGAVGAGTKIIEAIPDLPARHPLLIRDLPPDRAVEAAVDFLKSRLAGSPSPPHLVLYPRIGPEPRPDAIVLVTDEEGTLDEEALPLLAGLRRLALHPMAVSIGSGELDPDRLAGAGAVGAIRCETPERPIDARAAGSVLGVLARQSPGIKAVAVLATDFGRATAGRLAVRAAAPVIAEVTGGRRAGASTLWKKPSFAHRTMVAVEATKDPVVLTVRPGAWPEARDPEAPRLVVVRADIPVEPAASVRIDRATTLPAPWRGLATRRVVVVIGRGLGGPERIPELAPTLDAWEAGLAGTRKVVDDGWLPPALQVGLTGRFLEPEFALLLGVHGSPNHLTGVARARTLMAVDPDPAAPVFAHVDVGIVDRWEAVLPALTRELAGPLRRRAS